MMALGIVLLLAGGAAMVVGFSADMGVPGSPYVNVSVVAKNLSILVAGGVAIVSGVVLCAAGTLTEQITLLQRHQSIESERPSTASADRLPTARDDAATQKGISETLTSEGDKGIDEPSRDFFEGVARRRRVPRI